MNEILKSACVMVLLLITVSVAAPLAIFAWLFSSWMLDDSEALMLTSAGWLQIAGVRLVCGLLMASVVGFFFAGINYLVVSNLFLNRRTPWFLVTMPGWMMALATIVGCIHFIIVKPFM